MSKDNSAAVKVGLSFCILMIVFGIGFLMGTFAERDHNNFHHKLFYPECEYSKKLEW